MELREKLLKLTNPNYKPIVIFGEGRSGTTWLAQIICEAGYELNFEPIGSKNFSDNYKLPCEPIPYHYYIRKGEKNPYKKYMDFVMESKISDKFVKRGINIGSPKKLFKFIRASLMVDWMQENYVFYGIFLIRNPFATINSQLKTEFFKKVQKEGPETKYPKKVINYFNKKQQKIITNVKTPKDRLITHWCINNRIPLDVADRKSLVIVKYEDLVDNSKDIIKELSEFAHFSYNKKVRNMIPQKSFMTRKDTEDPRTDWKKNFTKKEIMSGAEIIKTFGLEEYIEL
jgi:hypothetical protein